MQSVCLGPFEDSKPKFAKETLYILELNLHLRGSCRFVEYDSRIVLVPLSVSY